MALPEPRSQGTLPPMTPDASITCPRCGERLPAGTTRCDACGAYLSAPSPSASAPRGPAPKVARQPAPSRPGANRTPAAASTAISGTSWIFLVAGLLCGGAIGYTLHGAVGPRAEEGGIAPPSDAMGSGMGGPPAGGAPAGMPQGQMPAQVMQMIGEYREKLAKNPDDVEANIGLGNLEFDSNQWEKAVEHYQKALDKSPGNADVRVDMAVAYHNLGQNDKAKAEMERVTKEHPDHRNAWLNLGVVCSDMGDKAGAIKSWEQYLKLEPNGPHSASIRAQIEDMKRGS